MNPSASRVLSRRRGPCPRRAGLLLLVPALAGCASAIHELPPRDNTGTYDTLVSTCPRPDELLWEPTRYRVLNRPTNFPKLRPILARPPKRPPIPPPLPGPPGPIPGPPPPFHKPGKLHPLLRDHLASPGPARRETLLVTFRETLRIPSLPSLDERSPKTSPHNAARLLQTRLRIAQIEALRDSAFDADSLDLVVNFGATVLHRHWLTHSMVIAMPLERVPLLARRRHVVYIQPIIGNEPPPSCPTDATSVSNGSALDNPLEGRRQMQSDAFRNLGLAYGYLSLLDTGICPGHCLLDGAKLGVAGDCVHGGPDCQDTTQPGFDPSDQYASGGGHGTASAALLVGDGSMGDEWRGATDGALDYFQVFSPGTCGSYGLCLNADAAVHAFEDALASGDRVILAELSSLASDWGAVGMSAQNAYEAGAVVVAANGNQGPTSGTVTSPASSPCVIGVGARDAEYLVTDAAQSLGPAYGGRIKPDIQAPTALETARIAVGDCEGSSRLGTHSGTSGATPLAGAAAALLRNWMKAGGDDVAPGHVYAGMILSGRHHGSNLNHTEGAGILELPTDGCAWWGSGITGRGSTWPVELDLTEVEADSLEVAVWWPEDLAVDAAGLPVIRHNDLDLFVVDPAGVAAAASLQSASIFERATAALTAKGVWTLRVEGVDFADPKANQVFYWMAAARKKR